MKPNIKFSIDDAEKAFDTWGANCGPGAIAAVLGLTLEEVHPHMGDFERKHYTNPRLMYQILKSLRVEFTKEDTLWPEHGLVRVQWCGPWTEPTAHHMARQRHTHWIGVNSLNDEIWIFDINCVCVGGWVNRNEWEDYVVPWLLKELEPGATSEWYPTHILEVDLAKTIRIGSETRILGPAQEAVGE